MNPDDYCQQKAARAGSSAYYSSMFLPPDKRSAITALHAFCREISDIVDHTSEESVARMKLGWWRDQVELIFKGKPDHPVAIALAQHVSSCRLKPDPLYAAIEGMEMDLTCFRYPDWAALHEYCWRVAGTIGELSAGIYGYSDTQTLQHAQKLGVALHLGSLIGKVGEDARRGRVYLPGDEMQNHNVDINDVLDGHYSDGFEALMQQQALRAREMFGEAIALLPEADRRAQRPGLILAAIHLSLLEELERERWQVLDQRIDLTPIRKFWLAWRAWTSGGQTVRRRLGI